jgi:hypothetical protein
MSIITTKYGTFEVQGIGNGTMLTMNGVPIISLPNVNWWDLDGIESALDKNSELVTKRIIERV